MAYRLTQRKKSILVALHVISVVAWFGATICMLLLLFYVKKADNGEELYYTLESMHILDDKLIKYPALAALFTGILLSVWTQWGLVKHYWVVIKLFLTVLTILLGIFFINDGFQFLLNTAKEAGIAALDNEEFQTKWLSNVLAATFNNLAYVFMVFLTYFKPYGKIRKKSNVRS